MLPRKVFVHSGSSLEITGVPMVSNGVLVLTQNILHYGWSLGQQEAIVVDAWNFAETVNFAKVFGKMFTYGRIHIANE